MKKYLILLFAFFSGTLIVFACLWDKDTIEMEKQEFPSIIELITGNFLRHSEEYHKWRIKDREEKLKQYPDSLSYYDDLAVSYSKLEYNKKAIEVILKKDKIKPGLYETYANLGTFYIHDGKLKKGIEYIDKAIEINPDAHFGREIYQKYVAEYILSKSVNGKVELPLDTGYTWHFESNSLGFDDFIILKYNELLDSANKVRFLPKTEINKAIKGITGMMKFGNYNSPILLEVLGDILSVTGIEEAPRILVSSAYLRASYMTKNKKVLYKRKIRGVLEIQQFKGISDHHFDTKIKYIQTILNEELKKGEVYFNQIRADEIAWIESGKNPEVEFAVKYYEKERPKVKVKKEVVKNDSLTERPISNDKKVVQNDLALPTVYIIIAFFLIGMVIIYIIRKHKF